MNHAIYWNEGWTRKPHATDSAPPHQANPIATDPEGLRTCIPNRLIPVMVRLGKTPAAPFKRCNASRDAGGKR